MGIGMGKWGNGGRRRDARATSIRSPYPQYPSSSCLRERGEASQERGCRRELKVIPGMLSPLQLFIFPIPYAQLPIPYAQFPISQPAPSGAPYPSSSCLRERGEASQERGCRRELKVIPGMLSPLQLFIFPIPYAQLPIPYAQFPIPHHRFMNYDTAYNFLLAQGTALLESQDRDDFLLRLQQGKPPVPGQVTSILLALRILCEGLQNNTSLDRKLVLALHLLAVDSQRLFDSGRKRGVDWPPLLKEDLKRIAIAVQSVFAGVWQS